MLSDVSYSDECRTKKSFSVWLKHGTAFSCYISNHSVIHSVTYLYSHSFLHVFIHSFIHAINKPFHPFQRGLSFSSLDPSAILSNILHSSKIIHNWIAQRHENCLFGFSFRSLNILHSLEMLEIITKVMTSWFNNDIGLIKILMQKSFENVNQQSINLLTKKIIVVAVAVVYPTLTRLIYLAFSGNLDLLYIPHPGMGYLV